MAEEASHKLSRMPGGAAYSKRLLGEFLLSMGDSRLAREAFGESLAAPAAEDVSRRPGNMPRRGIWRVSHGRLLSASSAWRRTPGRRICSAPMWSASMARFPRRWSYIARRPRSSLKIRLRCLGMGTVYWELGQYDDAEKCLRDTLRLNPRSEQAGFELANIAVRRHHYEDAIPLLEITSPPGPMRWPPRRSGTGLLPYRPIPECGRGVEQGAG